MLKKSIKEKTCHVWTKNSRACFRIHGRVSASLFWPSRSTKNSQKGIGPDIFPIFESIAQKNKNRVLFDKARWVYRRGWELKTIRQGSTGTVLAVQVQVDAHTRSLHLLKGMEKPYRVLSIIKSRRARHTSWEGCDFSWSRIGKWTWSRKHCEHTYRFLKIR